MNITTIFRQYIQEHCPHLNDNEWILDDALFRKEQLKMEHLKRVLPEGDTLFKCFCFIHAHADIAIYIILDQQGKKMYTIGSITI
ncbi:hypothetical protein [Sporolactobacillus laevolacticus]|uniref:Uncharacterized protein n=1 Tax=Sporolactobacillus laevolacticus DSM 442 TaxID=1395513 RepID=V6J5J0_9BACL|nr:hypothetical protein [Sporolactobacillus laevolacticus]EST11999.1 hypothetical protein P343_09905 [Sporolactobacillus laevolacticus DSM 442]